MAGPKPQPGDSNGGAAAADLLGQPHQLLKSLLAAASPLELEHALAALAPLAGAGPEEPAAAALDAALAASASTVRRRLYSAFEEDLPEAAAALAETLLLRAEHAASAQTALGPALEVDVTLAPALEVRAAVLAAAFAADPDHLVEAMPKEERTLRLQLPVPRRLERCKRKESPVPMMLWGSARLLAEALLAVPELVEGQRVLELGCGSFGVVALSAARAGAGYVLATDTDHDAVESTACRLRQQAASVASGGCAGQELRASRLDWRQPEECPDLEPGETFDLVLGADVVHEREHAQALFNALRTCLAKPQGRALLVNPARRHRFGVEEFQELLQVTGGDFQGCILPVPASLVSRLGEECADTHEASMQYELYIVQWCAADVADAAPEAVQAVGSARGA